MMTYGHLPAVVQAIVNSRRSDNSLHCPGTPDPAQDATVLAEWAGGNTVLVGLELIGVKLADLDVVLIDVLLRKLEDVEDVKRDRDILAERAWLLALDAASTLSLHEGSVWVEVRGD